MLESRELTKKFGRKTAVDHVTLRLEPGQICAMLGPNGSGKTTWMKMAAGLVKPTGGEILYNGKNIGIESRREIAYMSTEPYFYSWMSIKDVGDYYADFFTDFDRDVWTRLLGRMELTQDLKTKSLSSGMMAKLKIAATMSRKARVILLDEPFNGIDLLARDEITECIREAAGPEVILLLSSHLVEELETLADYAVFMKNGRLVLAAGVEELRADGGKTIVDRYREIYGHPGSRQSGGGKDHE